MCLLPRDRLSYTSFLIMGTRSLIGKQLKDGSILGVYCHYDGYPEYNGRMLRDHFDTDEKVNKLIDGGDMSCTWTNVGWKNETLPESGPLHYTARGESLESNAPKLYKDLNEFFTLGADHCDAEYTYHYTSAGWICHDVRPNPYTKNNVMEVPIPAGTVG